jgi:selenocysteine lyase/cysteine desulfurase
MHFDFAALRKQFPLLAHTTYLNNGSYGALALSVKRAFETYLEDRLRVGADWEAWIAKLESVRALTATLLGATAEEIAVTASVSAGLNAFASALDFSGARSKVVVSDLEFPTSAQIWHAQEPRGAQVVHVPCAPGGDIPVEMFERVIDEATQLVAVTHVSYSNGAKLDIAAIARVAHAKGARILLDCYQSVGSIDINVKNLNVDFAVGGMLKYLLGTAGIGFLYCRREFAEDLLPCNSGWFAQRDIAALDIRANRPALDARRFEAGTPGVVNCYAAEAGLRLIMAAGTPAIERRVYALTRRCMQSMTEIGWTSVTPNDEARHGAMVAFAARRGNEVCRELKARGIITSTRGDNVRASFHCYNDEADIEAFVAAMRDLRSHGHLDN